MKSTINATHIKVSAGVRYWEDATINGSEDTFGTLTPLRKGNRWCPVIRLSDGAVTNWPQGTTADIRFMVCDDGQYWLLDDKLNIVAKWTGFYVPNAFLCQGDRVYGDYIIMEIGADGRIRNWQAPEIEETLDPEEHCYWVKATA